MDHSWTQLADPVRRLHSTEGVLSAHGHLRVEHGSGYLAWIVVHILRLPRPCEAAETRLTVAAHGDGERWRRAFNGRRLETSQYQCAPGELAERFGLLELRFRLDVRAGSLHYIQRQAALRAGHLRVVIPPPWAPRVEAREDPAGRNRVNVTVRVTLPPIGRLMAYDGSVEIEDVQP